VTVDAVAGSGTVVVVEDDANIADLLDLYLRQAGFRVLQAASGERALELTRDHDPDLLVLDIGLPGIDGLEVCRRLRSTPRTASIPVLLLTARDGELDRVEGLELGADDYVTKPFSPREVVARVKAILRRAQAPTTRSVLVVGGVEIDVGRREASVGGTPVALATKEFDLLRHLAEHAGLALTRRQVLDAVWGYDWEGDERTVDVHVRQLRKKLGDALPLDTVWGVGYRLA
jgi:DNA-binding response OmpR family regulator